METQYLFLIGAAKSGTTKLADMLNEHRDICLSFPKEPDYFSFRVFNEKTLAWYDSLFESRTSKFRLDASTTYSAGWNGSSKDIAERIYTFSPSAHIFYLVRDPAKRAWSSYWHSVRTGVEKRTPEQALQDINSHHIQASLYHERIKDYLHFFPREQVHIIHFEEFIKHPELITRKIFAILGVDSIQFSINKNQKSVNESYQWSGLFNLAKILPLKYVKAFNNTVKNFLPESWHKAIKNKISKPIPNITPDIQAKINQLVEADFLLFKEEIKDLLINTDN